MTWVKWWKDKTFMLVLAIALLTMLIGFLFGYFLDWGWMLTILACLFGGIGIRRVITKRLDDESDI